MNWSYFYKGFIVFMLIKEQETNIWCTIIISNGQKIIVRLDNMCPFMMNIIVPYKQFEGHGTIGTSASLLET